MPSVRNEDGTAEEDEPAEAWWLCPLALCLALLEACAHTPLGGTIGTQRNSKSGQPLGNCNPRVWTLNTLIFEVRM